MAKPPGPLCGSKVGPGWIDEGTSIRQRSSAPGATGSASQSSSPRSKPRTPANTNPSIAIVGAPSKGFTVTGADVSGKAVAAMVSTDLASASCYDKPGGFILVETDPDILAVLQAEIDFSNSPWADPRTRMKNRYVPPSYFVGGGWTTDGTTLTITLHLTDTKGSVLLSKSGSGPAENFSDISGKVTKDLTDAMADGNWKSKSPAATTGTYLKAA